MKAVDWMFRRMSLFSLQMTTLAQSDAFHMARKRRGKVEQVSVQAPSCMFMHVD